MNIFLSISAIILYIAAAISRIAVSSKHILLLLGGLAVCLHALLLYQNIVTSSGLNLGFFNAISLMTWMIGVLLLLSRQPVENLAVVLFPIAALAIGLDGYFDTERILSPDQNFGVTLHILFSIVAYSLLSISALQAVFLAFQDYQLHHKRPGWVMQKLPPLQVMETLLFQMIALGFLLLSLSLISGFIFLEDIFGQHLVHKTVLSSVAWSVFAILLWGHWRYGWRGKTAIRWSISGFFVLMLAYFGSKLVLELILQR
ncbi:hypothetical protein PN36_19895 [Candidatus Thiomargarita nelsonii]|uniref:Cytochrome c assembly protein domain-containing protein n=1 Tax=Candidatus Thiomargarita nelsonii TaxID=1003181 RepID=A0A0A6P311_9GAMM|nr:hypothetical protein PN36_19895 [Candidatus Thiomargarita nelsonii]